MPPRKRKDDKTGRRPKVKGIIEGAGVVMEQIITDTLEQNYMPYAMSVIMSRAIPEIDGFKPSHRKLLYTMYKMGLLNGPRTKSANIVGETMKLNPHGDAAIYETMVRLSRDNETLLHPFVDSKGNFGKAYSRDMAYAAARYTEARLAPVCQELFGDIDKDTVDFVDNYDNRMKEPTLLPASFPTVLVNANTGIAVGMASSICPFNLTEICETTIGLIHDVDFDVSATLIAPDFPGGGQIIHNRAALNEIYQTGRGPIKVRARYTYDKSQHCIDVTQIPPTTTIEAIIEKVVDLVKQGKLKEISDIRDETGLDGLKVTIDLKRGVDADKLMARLFRMTPLEDTFSCNFNILIAGMPRVMGVKTILEEWIAFRIECVRRRIYFELEKKKKKLHLLRGLQKILLDIDKAIRIVRETEEESEVVPNLMIGFGIDEIQAEYVAEIKLRHLNREYILKRTHETEQLEKDIAELEAIFHSRSRVKTVIIHELKEISEKYGQPRKSMLIYPDETAGEEEEDSAPDYAVNLFFTRDGYFKKITPLSLRMSGEHKLKENDEIVQHVESGNNTEILFFTDKHQVYKTRASEFADTKTSVMGDFIPAKLGMEEGENAIYMAVTSNYSGYLLFFFQNGRVAKVALSAYYTKTNRKKLVGAYSDKFPLTALWQTGEDREYMLTSSSRRMLLLHSGAVQAKSTKNTQGVQVMTQRKGHTLISAEPYEMGTLDKEHRYRVKNLPGAGALPTVEGFEQTKL